MKKNAFKITVTALIIAVVIIGGLLVIKNVKTDKPANGDNTTPTENAQKIKDDVADPNAGSGNYEIAE